MTVPAVIDAHDGPARQYCGAKTRGATAKYPTCRQAAGWGTDHPGSGRCKLHGGKSLVRHGRYSAIKRDHLRLLIEQHEKDPDPLNILPEIAANRALFQDFVERYDEWAAALIAWHESYRAGGRPLAADRILQLRAVVDEFELLFRESDELTEKQRENLDGARATIAALEQAPDDGKPVQILDIADASRILSETTKMVERVERIRAANAVSRPELFRIMGEMWRVVELNVSDAETRARVRDAWLGIRL